MPFQKHALAAKVEANPREAAEFILAVYARKKASQKATAASLGCAENTLIRWIKILDGKGTGIVRAMEREHARAEKAGHPTRPAQGWRRKPEAKAS